MGLPKVCLNFAPVPRWAGAYGLPSSSVTCQLSFFPGLRSNILQRVTRGRRGEPPRHCCFGGYEPLICVTIAIRPPVRSILIVDIAPVGALNAFLVTKSTVRKRHPAHREESLTVDCLTVWHHIFVAWWSTSGNFM